MTSARLRTVVGYNCEYHRQVNSGGSGKIGKIFLRMDIISDGIFLPFHVS